MSEIIFRLLGDKWKKVFLVLSSILMIFVTIIIYMLINSTLYSIISFVLEEINFKNFAPSYEIDFTKWSI